MHRVLVVDDSEDIRFALRTILEDAGYAVEEAADGAQAVVAAMRSCPDAMLLDLLLPPTGGFDVLRQIKSTPTLRGIPVIVVASSAATQDLETAAALGASDYIVKPWAPGEIEARVGYTLRSAQLAPMRPATVISTV